MARVLAGLDTTTRPARLASNVAIAQVFPVASNATSSAGASSSANARTPPRVVANWPDWGTTRSAPPRPAQTPGAQPARCPAGLSEPPSPSPSDAHHHDRERVGE